MKIDPTVSWKELMGCEDQPRFKPPHWFSVFIEVTSVIGLAVLAAYLRFTAWIPLSKYQDYSQFCNSGPNYSNQYKYNPFTDNFTEAFYFFSLLSALILVLVYEFERSYYSKHPSYLHFSPCQRFLYIALRPLGFFTIGVLIVSITVDLIKVQVAWPRPYSFYKFPDLCNSSTQLDGTESQAVRYALTAFPSHLTAVTGFCSTLCAVYTHHSNTLDSAPLTKPIIKMMLFLLTGTSAIYKINVRYNHWFDVVLGLLIGALFGYLTHSVLWRGYTVHLHGFTDNSWKLLLPRVNLPKQVVRKTASEDYLSTGNSLSLRSQRSQDKQQPYWLQA